MKLLQFRTLWGVTDDCDGPAARSPVGSFEQAIARIKQLGFDGIEIPFKYLLSLGVARVQKLLVENELQCNLMIFTDNVVCPGAGILWGGPYEMSVFPFKRVWSPDWAVPTTPTNKYFFTPPPDTAFDVVEKARTDDEYCKQHTILHFEIWAEQVAHCFEFKENGFPLHLVVSHSGRDYFTEQMANFFFKAALEYEQRLVVYEQQENNKPPPINTPLGANKNKNAALPFFKVCHETHRSRILYSPWRSVDLLQRFPSLKLTADLSHWVCTAESTDANLENVVKFVAKFVHHTHCRYGHEQGSQIPDPRFPEWGPQVETHDRWWDLIWQAQKERGEKVTTMIAEHGPPPYQICTPGGKKEPLAKTWEVNHWVHLRRQKRFGELFPDPMGTNNRVLKEDDGTEVAVAAQEYSGA
eukprot:g3090.t1